MQHWRRLTGPDKRFDVVERPIREWPLLVVLAGSAIRVEALHSRKLASAHAAGQVTCVTCWKGGIPSCHHNDVAFHKKSELTHA